MTDIHKTGLCMSLGTNPDGLFARTGTLNNFEASLKGVSDLSDYIGVVMLMMMMFP